MKMSKKVVKKAVETVTKKPENLNDLRDILCGEIEKISNGTTTPANVNAITNATGKICSTIKLELEYAKMTGKKTDINFIGQLK